MLDDPVTEFEDPRVASHHEFQQRPGFFKLGPLTEAGHWCGYLVGVVPDKIGYKGFYVTGRGDTLDEALDEAIINDKKQKKNGRR